MWIRLAFITALGVASLTATPIVSVQPMGLGVLPNSTFLVRVDITGVVDLFAFQLDLAYDPSILSVVDVLEGDVFAASSSSFFSPGFVDPSTGVVEASVGSILGPDPGFSGDATLFSVMFEALAPGVSVIELFNVELLDSTLFNIAFTSQAGSVNVSDVPEPASGWLLGLALAVLWAALRRQRARAAT